MEQGPFTDGDTALATGGDVWIVGNHDHRHPRRAWRSSSRSRTDPAVTESRLPVGSSQSKQARLADQGRGATATRWHSPPDMVDGNASARWAQADAAQGLRGRPSCRRWRPDRRGATGRGLRFPSRCGARAGGTLGRRTRSARRRSPARRPSPRAPTSTPSSANDPSLGRSSRPTTLRKRRLCPSRTVRPRFTYWPAVTVRSKGRKRRGPVVGQGRSTRRRASGSPRFTAATAPDDHPIVDGQARRRAGRTSTNPAA